MSENQDGRFYGLFYNTVTGAVVGGEVPFLDAPYAPWTQQINQQCTWSLTTPIGHSGGRSRDQLRALVKPAKYGIALCYGPRSASDYIAQAGPIWSHSLVQENPAQLQINGAGMWSLLQARVQVPSTWTPSMGLQDSRSIATYAGSYRDIAAAIIRNAVNRGALPIDLPATPDGGPQSMTYSGFDLTSAGQRLLELTQKDQGPDVYFRPYFADPQHVRWEAVIGNPTITNTGAPLLFDHGSNMVQCLTTSDGTGLATDTYEKGNGTQTSILWAYANDVSLIANGWPLLDKVDSNHIDSLVQADLNSWVAADQALNGRSVETWAVTVRTDQSCPLGTYGPGVTAGYNFTTHQWIPPGQYEQRLIGLGAGRNINEVLHIVQAGQGAV